MTKRINMKLLEEQFSLKEKDIQPPPGDLLFDTPNARLTALLHQLASKRTIQIIFYV